MLHLFNQVMMEETLAPYGSPEGFRRYCESLGFDGGEGIWGGEPIPEGYADRTLFPGYHLIFFSDWLDFWLEDQERLDAKFGGRKVWQDFYQGKNREDMFRQYQEDLERAVALDVRYVVFHVSDVSIEETCGFPREHSDELVIDCAAECINRLLDGKDYHFDFLMENLWWPGLTMADPAMTRRLLDQVHYPKKGIMLDTGHLLNTNLDLFTEDQAIDYLFDRVRAHGDLAKYIKGLHLQKSLSSQYVLQQQKLPKPELPRDYMERFSFAYDRIYGLDPHLPFENPRIREFVEFVDPSYVVHELSGTGEKKTQYLKTQIAHFRCDERG